MFRFKTRGSLSNIKVQSSASVSPLVTPSHDLPPRIPDGPSLITPDTSSSNVAMLKASAGSLFSRIKDTTKSVVNTVQSSMGGRELDFHCITSRVAAMSLPAEGLESTVYKNNIDDVRAMMESRFSGHYTVYNVSEKPSNPSKYPSGKLVEAGWSVSTVPSLDSTLDLCSNMLDYLSRDMRNVVVVYCVDGKSSTAYMISALMLYTGLVSSAQAALSIFSSKRCEPVLTCGQLESLNNLASLATDKPPVLKSPFVTLTNIVIEPIPLFNKAGDGCRPYVEVYQGKDRVISTVQEYTRMRGYCVTSGDEAAVIPINVTVCGDMTIIINHARQVLGSIKPVKMCQVQVHTSSLTPGRPSYTWSLAQLDSVAEVARFSADFRLVLNNDISEECSGRQMDWPDASAAMLLFDSEQDYEYTKSLAPSSSSSSSLGSGRVSQNNQSTFYVNNPDLEKKSGVSSPASSVDSPVDLLGLSSSSTVPENKKPQIDIFQSGCNNISSNSKPVEDTLLSDFNSTSTKPSKPPAPASSNTFDFLGDLGAGSSSSSSSAKLPQNTGQVNNTKNMTDLFGGLDMGLSTPVLNATSVPRVSSQPDVKKTEDNFDPFGDFGNLSSSMSSQSLAGKTNNQTQKPASNSSQMGPNYSRSFFSDNTNNSSSGGSGGVKPKVSSNAFDDLLGGFNPSSRDANQNKSIGAMKKVELVKAMDPDEAKIFEWREGKARNIRTLLCSLHKIIWSSAR